MAIREIISCDWCCVDSSMGDQIPTGWKVHHVDSKTKVQHLCGECDVARTDALEAARKKRFRETHPLKTDEVLP